ncbi:hypothetical protein TNCV_3418071 [Trichonephila clavipes]|nr:hypothetical protein TNCV_3418071 [Trichonephila clavipes]
MGGGHTLKKASARITADSLFDNYISRYGAPVKLISDNGPQFISDIFEHLCNRLSIRHVKTVVYRPQKKIPNRGNNDAKYQWLQLATKTWVQRWSPDQPMRRGHNKEGQFNPEEAERNHSITLRRGAKKVKHQEYQNQKRSATSLPGEDRRSEQSKNPVP